jgi:hypothetical protein
LQSGEPALLGAESVPPFVKVRNLHPETLPLPHFAKGGQGGFSGSALHVMNYEKINNLCESVDKFLKL